MPHFGWISLSVVALVLVAFERQSAAQGAWVEGQRSLILGLSYNYAQSDKVIGDSTLNFPDTGVRTQEFTARIEYVPVKHLAVGVQLPFLAIEYIGNKTAFPHPGGGNYDDGATHYTLTDFRADVRYQLLEDPIALTPLIGVSVPATNYETVGNAVAGRHLDQLHVGAAAGRVFGNFYVHALYTFSFVQRVEYSIATKRFNENHSDGSLRLGYTLLGDKLDVNVEADGRVTHGGLDFDDRTNTKAELLYHDAYLHEVILVAGPGIGYEVTSSFSVDLFARFFITGLNTQNANVFGAGLIWNAL